MIQKSQLKTNYSSSVELYLVVGDERWELASIGPDHVTSRQGEIELDKNCRGQIVMLVDGIERRWEVLLKNGAVPFEPTIPISNAD